MFSLIKKIQDIIVQNKEKKLESLVYKNYIRLDRPTELEKTISFDYFSRLDPPASNQSDATKKDLYTVVNSTVNIPEHVIETILTIDKDPLFIYKNVLLTHKVEFPQEEFDQLYNILRPIIKDIKIFYNRPRPYQLSEFYNLKINVIETDTHHTPSYPSGHVAYAKLAELLLIEKYPTLKDKFEKMTDKVKLARIKQGVHYPSDNEGSIQLVNNIYNDIKLHIKNGDKLL